MRFCMLDCSLLLTRCIVATRSLIACFAAVVSFAQAAEVCSELNSEAIEQRC